MVSKVQILPTHGKKQLLVSSTLNTTFLAVITSWVYIASFETFDFSSVPFVIISLMSIAMLHISQKNTKKEIVTIIFWLFTLIWLGLSPLAQVNSNSRPLPFEVSNSDYMQAGWIILVGLFAYVISYNKKPNYQRLNTKKLLEVDPKLHTYYSGFASVLCVFLIYRNGAASYWTSREEFTNILYGTNAIDKSLGAIESSLNTVTIFVSLVLYLIRWSKGTKFGSIDKLLFTLVMLLNIFVNNPVTQGRFWFTTVWGTVSLIVLWKTKLIFMYFSLIATLFVLVIFPASDIYRNANSERTLTLVSPVESLSRDGDFDAAEQIAWGARIVKEDGHALGRQILGSVLFFVPRSIWENKSRDTGTILAQRAGFKNLSLSSPIWIEAFFDFGWFGVIAFLSLIGTLHRRITFWQSEENTIFFCIFGFYQLVILRGSLLQSMGITTVIFISHYALLKKKHVKDD